MLSSEFAPSPNFPKCPPSMRLCSPLPLPRSPSSPGLGCTVWGKREEAAQVLVYLVSSLVSPFQLSGPPAEVPLPSFPDLTLQNALPPQTGDGERVPGRGVEDREGEAV